MFIQSCSKCGVSCAFFIDALHQVKGVPFYFWFAEFYPEWINAVKVQASPNLRSMRWC